MNPSAAPFSPPTTNNRSPAPASSAFGSSNITNVRPVAGGPVTTMGTGATLHHPHHNQRGAFAPPFVPNKFPSSQLGGGPAPSPAGGQPALGSSANSWAAARSGLGNGGGMVGGGGAAGGGVGGGAGTGPAPFRSGAPHTMNGQPPSHSPVGGSYGGGGGGSWQQQQQQGRYNNGFGPQSAGGPQGNGQFGNGGGGGGFHPQQQQGFNNSGGGGGYGQHHNSFGSQQHNVPNNHFGNVPPHVAHLSGPNAPVGGGHPPSPHPHALVGGQQQAQQQAQQQQQQQPRVVLLFDADAQERGMIAAYLANKYDMAHIALNDMAADAATVHYKEFRRQLAETIAAKTQAAAAAVSSPTSTTDAASSPSPKPQPHVGGYVIEMKLSYHASEVHYYFQELRIAKIFPTHIFYVEHATLAEIPGSAMYESDQRTHHPLAFEGGLQLEPTAQFTMINGTFTRDAASGGNLALDSEGMAELEAALATRNEPLLKIPDSQPTGVFALIPLHPDVNLLTDITDKFSQFFGKIELYARPQYAFHYFTLARNGFQLPHYWSTIDLNGIDVVITKVKDSKGGQYSYYVLFPNYVALGLLDESQIPEGLRAMTAAPPSNTASSAAAANASPSVDSSAVTSPVTSTAPTTTDAGTAAAPAEANPYGIAWVINATICYNESEEESNCTIYAKDIVCANGRVVASKSFVFRHELLKSLVPERPTDEKIIVVRQRYYPMSETESIFKKLEATMTITSSSNGGGSAGGGAVTTPLSSGGKSGGGNNDMSVTTAGNGIWFVNPGKAELKAQSTWNFRFPLHEGGFDGRLWNGQKVVRNPVDGSTKPATEEDSEDSVWTFDIYIIIVDPTSLESVENDIGKVFISCETVEKDSLNDGQIVRLLVQKEIPKPPPEPAAAAPTKPKPKGKAAAQPQQPQPQPQLIEPIFHFTYLRRQPWVFMPTNENPKDKRLSKKDLLEAIASLKAN